MLGPRALVSLALLGYLVLSVAGGILLAERTLQRPRRPVGPAAARYAAVFARSLNSRVEDVAITAADGARLRGWLFEPAALNGHTVLLLHAISGNRTATLALAQVLLPKGFRVLAVDARGHGDSGGAFASFGAMEAGDVRQWIGAAKTSVPGACVYTIGSSLGAAHALQASDAHELCGVIAMSGYFSLREIAFDRIGQQVGAGDWFGRLPARLGIEAAILYTRLRYGVDFGSASAHDAVGRPGAPILVVHGALDDNVPPRHAQLVREANPSRVTVWLVPGGDHNNLGRAAGAQFHSRILAFLTSNR